MNGNAAEYSQQKVSTGAKAEQRVLKSRGIGLTKPRKRLIRLKLLSISKQNAAIIKLGHPAVLIATHSNTSIFPLIGERCMYSSKLFIERDVRRHSRVLFLPSLDRRTSPTSPNRHSAESSGLPQNVSKLCSPVLVN